MNYSANSIPGFQRCSCAVTSGSFIRQIEAGYVTPEQMADVIYAMNSAMVDRFPAVALLIPTDLEKVADSIVKATRIQAIQEQDYPLEVA